MFGVDDAALAAGGANLLGTILTNQSNQDIAASNNVWSAQQYATRYQTMTQDMQKAGLNPMLAYSQSAGSAPSAQAVQFQNPMASAFQGAQMYTDTEKARAEIDNVHIMNEKIKADAEASTAAARVSNAQASKTVVETQRELENLPKLRSEAAVQAATIPLKKQEVKTSAASAASALAASRKLSADAAIIEADRQRAENERAAQTSWWKRKVSPYLPDLGSVNKLTK